MSAATHATPARRPTLTAIKWNGREYDAEQGLSPDWRDLVPPDDWNPPAQLARRQDDEREAA